jgi:arylsulfatase
MVVIILLSLSTHVFAQQSPNIVIIYADDMGYADPNCYGSKIKTPNINKLTKEGVRFTDFYVAQPVCSASRASLLTGCYPNRIGIHGALGPASKNGISDNEVTLAEICKQKNYATAIFGKWHLGHHQSFLPTQHGFDNYFGLPYSNDMWPYHPTNKSFPQLPLIEQDSTVKIIEGDQDMLTTWYTEHAVKFINDNRGKPFFLYLAHNMPHVPIYASAKYKGKSGMGLYADVIEEIDWSVGEVMKMLKKNKLDKNTLIIFASDNGPWLSYGDHAGSAYPLREGKATVFEGGVRVPCIMRWPGKIPAGKVQHEPAMTIDVLPTIAKLLKASLPEHTIDGKDIWPLISLQPNAKSPQEAYFFYYNTNELQGMRMGPWKLYFPHTYSSLQGKPGGTNGMPVPYERIDMTLSLYNLDKDISEKMNVIDQYPEVVKEMLQFADTMKERLGDSLIGAIGTENREPGRVETN